MLDWLSKCLTLAREYEGLTDQYVQCKKCIAGLQKIQRKQDTYLKRKVDLWKISVACALCWLFVVGLGCFSCTPLFAGILFYYKSLPVWLKSGIVILTAVIIYLCICNLTEMMCFHKTEEFIQTGIDKKKVLSETLIHEQERLEKLHQNIEDVVRKIESEGILVYIPDEYYLSDAICFCITVLARGNVCDLQEAIRLYRVKRRRRRDHVGSTANVHDIRYWQNLRTKESA